MNKIDRALAYSTKYPNRPPLSTFSYKKQVWISGTWLIGSCYKNPNPLYGAYPYGYLDRVHSMFPDAKNILHAFSGGLTLEMASKAAWNVEIPPANCSITLVDIHGPSKGRYPTWQGELEKFCSLPEYQHKFDLVLADPPYSKNDSEKYDTKMVNRNKVLKDLHKVTLPTGNLIWLDQVWPMFQKKQWHCWGQIGLVRSTNHRIRLVSCFEAK